jgi:5-oxopent-3-ene-1,2,5-tricarboxylate decarboxylase/2-hydroxyhepta-2,4-diene-1,7-dioate isomerase
MKHVRFFHKGRTVCGFIDGGEVVTYDEDRIPLGDVNNWLCPIEPHNMFVAALNYEGIFDDQQLEKPITDPVIFQKFNTTLIGHRGNVIFPNCAEDLACENSLLVVIGKGGRKINRKNTFQHIAGYMIGNDVTIPSRITEQHSRPPLKAKQFDTFGPAGPCLVDRDDIINVQSLEIKTYINGDLKQISSTAKMTYDIGDLIEYISSYMTLCRGDVIWTGTPRGVVKVQPGDVMRLEIEGLGVLENTVVKE